MRWGNVKASAYFGEDGLLRMLQIDSGRISRDEKLPDLRRRTELRKRLLNTPDALSADDLEETTRGRRNSHGERLVPTGEQFRPDDDQKRKRIAATRRNQVLTAEPDSYRMRHVLTAAR